MKILLASLLVLMQVHSVYGQVNYGNNPKAGHYQRMADGTSIYYEIYGSGKPLLLLHGGLFGDIGEYGHLIPLLAAHFQVTALDTRGHAKSFIGHQAYTMT
jgi:pimeloyl-ACP methyl ester carboxylesterase